VHPIAFAAHRAVLAPTTGTGLLVRPHPDDDVPALDGMVSLHHADWNAAMTTVSAMGWEPVAAADGGLSVVGYTDDGRDVVSLSGTQPVAYSPTATEAAETYRAMCAAVGVVTHLS
jgi:hypothetical protein